MNANENSGLKQYLKSLDKAPLLTREEERILLQKISKNQSKLLMECSGSAFFKSELANLLMAQDVKEIVNISRKLNVNSTKKEQKAISKKFLKLVELLVEETSDKKAIKLHLEEVSISGTLVNALLTKLKKKYKKIEEGDAKLKSLHKYFETSTYDDLTALIAGIKSDKEIATYYSRKFYTSVTKLNQRAHELDMYQNMLKSLHDQGIGAAELKDIKNLNKHIRTMEFEIEKYKNELIQKNLRLVVSRAKKFTNRGLDFEDLVQEGNIGLIKAINKHDVSRQLKISTYATWWIDQAIRRAISNKSKTVRIPTHIEFLQSIVATIVSALTQELGRAPTNKEIVARAKKNGKQGVSVSALERIENAAIYKVGIEDSTTGGVSLMDVLPSDGTDNPYAITTKKLLRERIRKILATLSPRTEKIIRLRFGIGEPFEELTLQKIADQVGLTKMGVTLVQNKGLLKMKKGDLDDSRD